MEKMELIFDSFEVSGNGTDDISSYNPVCKIARFFATEPFNAYQTS